MVELREITDREAIVAVDVENRQRTDVSPYERGLFFARCLRAGHYKSQEELAADLKISQSQVSRLLKLARLPSVIVNAFENPLEIREGWGPDLIETLEDVERRKQAIALARTFVDMSPRPAAMDVYQQLISAAVSGRKSRAKPHDEVVTDANGSPLFRIRRQARTIALLLPIEKISADILDAVRDAVRDVLKEDPQAAPDVEVTEHYASRRANHLRSQAVGSFDTFRANGDDYQDPGIVGGRDS
jgi:ParB family chromosome partitioning protein